MEFACSRCASGVSSIKNYFSCSACALAAGIWSDQDGSFSLRSINPVITLQSALCDAKSAVQLESREDFITPVLLVAAEKLHGSMFVSAG